MSSIIETVATSQGEGRMFISPAADATATLMLGHGAGGGVEARDLLALANRLPDLGITVVRFEQPWRTAGRKVASPPPRLDEAWRPAAEWLLSSSFAGGRLYFGGRSSGARVACRMANEFAVAGVVALCFPLHPPGKPEKSRIAELLMPSVPRLVLQGTRDNFGGPDEVSAAISEAGGAHRIEVIAVTDADHSYRVPKASASTGAAAIAQIVAEVARFCRE